MIPHLETHLADLGNLVPIEIPLRIVHPSMSYKKCRAKTHLLKQRRNKVEMGSKTIIEGQYHGPRVVGV
jgi:hypothetical protein